MADMAAKAVKDEQTVKKVAVVGGGLVRISVKVPGFLEEIIFFILDDTAILAGKIVFKVASYAQLSLDLIARVKSKIDPKLRPKCSLNRRLSVDEKHFENGAFQNR